VAAEGEGMVMAERRQGPIWCRRCGVPTYPGGFHATEPTIACGRCGGGYAWPDVCEAGGRHSNAAAMPQVRALLAAGWRVEWPDHDLDTWQWAWRRPARRPGQPGRRFASTNQAFQSLCRDAGADG
jgi:hypothetical protein